MIVGGLRQRYPSKVLDKDVVPIWDLQWSSSSWIKMKSDILIFEIWSTKRDKSRGRAIAVGDDELYCLQEQFTNPMREILIFQTFDKGKLWDF